MPSAERLLPVTLCCVACAFGEPIDFAHVDNGTTVRAVSQGVNPPPYDARAAIGDGSHLSYPGALPNWFELDLGQVRRVKSIEIDRRYADKGPDNFDISFAKQPDEWVRTIEVRGVGSTSGKYWFRVMTEPVEARYVRLNVLALHNYQWTTLNRFSLYGTSRIPRLMAENVDRYSWLAERLRKLTEESEKVAAPPSGSLPVATAEVTGVAALLTREDDITGDQWQCMDERFTGLQTEAYEAEARLSFVRLRNGTDGAVTVGAVDGMTKVFRHVWPANATRKLALSCARNEREGGQILLAATRQDLADVEVSVDPLVGPTTLKGAVEAGLVCYVRTRDTPRLAHHVGLWPDGISPLATFSLPRGQVQPIWLTVAIPENAPPGLYESAAHIQVDGLAQMTVPVEVRVWSFALPTKTSLQNVFSVSSLLVDAWYRSKKLGWEDLKEEYYDFWLKHRLNPTSLYGQMQPPPADLDGTLAGGMNAFVVKYVYSGGARAKEAYFQQVLKDLAVWDDTLAARDLYDEAIVYLADEPAKKKSVTDEINRRASIIGDRFPKMRRMLVLTRPIDDAFAGNVDIWCPIVSAMRPDDVRAAHRRGEQCWWYSVGHFFNLDAPAVAARSMPWLSFKHGIDGILYWMIQSSWRKPNRPSRFHPRPGETVWETFELAGHGGHNGIGNMCYPGSDGRPWSSQRLEILRDGMEDYEYLVLLRQTLAQRPNSPFASLLRTPDKLATEYAVDTNAGFIMQHREALAKALHALHQGTPR
ncbi:MAG: DUF4091 domain-containing protein [Lentisphaerae bacterium]|jgi:hypothetical protein|nr:DUF4091 domain-containing protein [Lentisphaerota bacterium]MBT4818232.1 DUF4091 domain-containing protein [Lentisphaerota bacterium]MBT5613015.1 DUF4091 domain-containing protein [Lentisphaerota bacterium]MBT7056739.1 DUF4091 domain-containing protein [Lentisphaerota bacterium]MBT7843743.1 DUF4091 domain-containing protein [Lentisphaerota bacterium]